jgi:nucleotide-binding universal stress UspA family protein
LKWIKAEFPALNLNVKVRSIFGSPVDAIKKIHKESAHEMVVMGTKGASGVDAVLFGSVASTVIRTTVVPVISVPVNYEYKGFNEIVFATDGVTDYKSRSLEPIQKLHAKFKSQVTVFSVNKEGEDKDFLSLNIDIKNAHYSTVEDNNIASAVTTFCKEKNADLLVLLPKHTGFFDRLFHKSVSKELVEQAQLPILSLEND